MPAPRFTMVVLLVEDIARSVAFYRRLGVEFAQGAEERADVGVDIGDGRTIIWTTTFGRNDPNRQPPGGGSRIMLEFFVESNAAVDEKFAELMAAGYHAVREPFTTNFDAYMCLVDDPDGNTVLVTAG
jgi:predicted lactoylglutathione lyase